MTEDVTKVFVQDIWQEESFSEWLANLTASNEETNEDLHETCNASKLTEIRLYSNLPDKDHNHLVTEHAAYD